MTNQVNRLSKKKTRPSLRDLTWTIYTLSMLDIDDGLRKDIYQELTQLYGDEII